MEPIISFESKKDRIPSSETYQLFLKMVIVISFVTPALFVFIAFFYRNGFYKTYFLSFTPGWVSFLACFSMIQLLTVYFLKFKITDQESMRWHWNYMFTYLIAILLLSLFNTILFMVDMGAEIQTLIEISWMISMSCMAIFCMGYILKFNVLKSKS